MFAGRRAQAYCLSPVPPAGGDLLVRTFLPEQKEPKAPSQLMASPAPNDERWRVFVSSCANTGLLILANSTTTVSHLQAETVRRHEIQYPEHDVASCRRLYAKHALAQGNHGWWAVAESHLISGLAPPGEVHFHADLFDSAGNQCQPLGQPAAASAAGQEANSEPAAAVVVNPPQPVLPPIEHPPLGHHNSLGHVDTDFPEVEPAPQESVSGGNSQQDGSLHISVPSASAVAAQRHQLQQQLLQRQQAQQQAQQQQQQAQHGSQRAQHGSQPAQQHEGNIQSVSHKRRLSQAFAQVKGVEQTPGDEAEEAPQVKRQRHGGDQAVMAQHGQNSSGGPDEPSGKKRRLSLSRQAYKQKQRARKNPPTSQAAHQSGMTHPSQPAALPTSRTPLQQGRQADVSMLLRPSAASAAAVMTDPGPSAAASQVTNMSDAKQPSGKLGRRQRMRLSFQRQLAAAQAAAVMQQQQQQQLPPPQNKLTVDQPASVPTQGASKISVKAGLQRPAASLKASDISVSAPGSASDSSSESSSGSETDPDADASPESSSSEDEEVEDLSTAQPLPDQARVASNGPSTQPSSSEDEEDQQMPDVPASVSDQAPHASPEDSSDDSSSAPPDSHESSSSDESSSDSSSEEDEDPPVRHAAAAARDLEPDVLARPTVPVQVAGSSNSFSSSEDSSSDSDSSEDEDVAMPDAAAVPDQAASGDSFSSSDESSIDSDSSEEQEGDEPMPEAAAAAPDQAPVAMPNQAPYMPAAVPNQAPAAPQSSSDFSSNGSTSSGSSDEEIDQAAAPAAGAAADESSGGSIGSKNQVSMAVSPAGNESSGECDNIASDGEEAEDRSAAAQLTGHVADESSGGVGQEGEHVLQAATDALRTLSTEAPSDLTSSGASSSSSDSSAASAPPSSSSDDAISSGAPLSSSPRISEGSRDADANAAAAEEADVDARGRMTDDSAYDPAEGSMNESDYAAPVEPAPTWAHETLSQQPAFLNTYTSKDLKSLLSSAIEVKGLQPQRLEDEDDQIPAMDEQPGPSGAAPARAASAGQNAEDRANKQSKKASANDKGPLVVAEDSECLEQVAQRPHQDWGKADKLAQMTRRAVKAWLNEDRLTRGLKEVNSNIYINNTAPIWWPLPKWDSTQLHRKADCQEVYMALQKFMREAGQHQPQ
ncbi:hypothetical protein WJX77_003911 [Trebouxia sp. C0004]